MDINQFFENVGRNFADNDGAQGLLSSDPKGFSEYVNYLKDMGLLKLGYRLEIRSPDDLSEADLKEILRNRITLNPELSEYTSIGLEKLKPTEHPKRIPIGTARIMKRSAPLSQIHKEALNIVRESADGKFSSRICRQVCHYFARGAFGGDGGVIITRRGIISINYSEQDPFKRALVRDSIKTGFDVTIRDNPERGQLITSKWYNIIDLAKNGIMDSNALRAARLYAKLIQRTEGAEREELLQKLQDLEIWLRPFIKSIRELDRNLLGYVISMWKDFIELLVDILPPEDISPEFQQPPTGS